MSELDFRGRRDLIFGGKNDRRVSDCDLDDTDGDRMQRSRRRDYARRLAEGFQIISLADEPVSR